MIAGGVRRHTAQLEARRRSRSGLTALLAIVAMLLPLGLASLVVPIEYVVLLFAVLAIAIPWLWRQPVRSVFILFGGALLIEIFPLGFSDSLTDKIPLFTNLNSSAGLSMPIAPVEVVMLLALLVWLAAGVSQRKLALPSRRLLPAYLVFISVTVIAELHGLLSGGDFKLSLWELRPQAYGFVMFFLSASLVRDRRDISRLAVIFFAIVTLKAIIGMVRYVVTTHGILASEASILSHEESYFLSLFLVGLIVVMIWYPRRRLILALLAATPIVAAADLANRRRVGILALQLGIAIVVVLAIRFEPRIRRRLTALAVASLAATVVFMAAFWNAENGLPGQLVRPVKSVLFGADQRDILSNLYRVAENANLLAAFRSSPLVGLGFGKPFPVIFPMADISFIYPLWNVIPHNTLLWLGIRMGLVGIVAFWSLVGLAIGNASHQLATRRDPLLKAFAAFAIAAIAAELVVAWGDLQLENVRNMMFLGVVLGVLDRLPAIKDASA